MLRNVSLSLLVIVMIVANVHSKVSPQQQQTLTPLQYKYLIFTTQCYDTFFHKADWFNFDCLKMTATKIIGYSLVVGGAIVKLPQILKVIANKSVIGVSFISVVLELSSNILASGYCIYKGNPFSLYGQNVFIGAQMLVIILLFVLFGTGSKPIYLLSFLIMVTSAYLATDPQNIPDFVIQNSIIVQTLLICTSRMSQIIEVYRLKSTGSLALITFALSFLGNIGRVATIMVQASNDLKFLMSMVSVTFLNGYIVFQFYLYRDSIPKSSEKND